VEPARVRAALAERGLRRVLSEGGPTVLAAFAAAGELDELCLSLTPLLAGPVAPRILSGPAWTGGTLPLALTGLLEEDGALFLRYRAVRSRAAGDEPLPLG
jgi:riboflavin biosynthesis pyrimidine reductase